MDSDEQWTYHESGLVEMLSGLLQLFDFIPPLTPCHLTNSEKPFMININQVIP